MKKLLSVALAAIVLAATAAAQTASPASAAKDAPLVSITLHKTETINRVLFNKLLANVEKQAGRTLSAAEKRAQLDKQVNAVIVAQQAENEKITIGKDELPADLANPVYTKAAAESGLTPKEVQDTIRLQLLSARYLQYKQAELSKPEEMEKLEKELKISDKDYEEAYNKNLATFLRPATLQFRYIAIDFSKMTADQKKAARQTMDGFYAQVKSGGAAKLDELIQKSKDSVAYAGDTSPYIRQDTPLQSPKDQEFMAALFKMKKGEISGVLESNSSFYIAQIVDRREPALIGIDEPVLPGQKVTPRDSIRQTLLLQVGLENLVKKLKAKAEVKYFEANITW